MEVDVGQQICDFSKCGPSIVCTGGLSSISSLKKDVLQHLKRCQSSPKYEHVEIPEGLLILFRSGLFQFTNDILKFNVCENHRSKLGTRWYRSSRRCSHPLHPPHMTQKPDRGVTCSMSKEIYLHERQVVPVGSGEDQIQGFT